MVRIILMILVTFLISSCDLFRVRDSEEPAAQPLWCNFFSYPDSTLANLIYSYEDSRNVVKYHELFSDDYRFYFSAQDANDYNINQIWNRDQERDMLYNLQNWATSMDLQLNKITNKPDQIYSTQATLYRSYNLTLNRGKLQSTYQGNLEILLKLENGFWFINKWYDYRSSSSPTWGKLKYDFSQQ